MFANSSSETKTTTEKGFVDSFAKQIGDIGAIMIAILGAVLFTILLVVANTMMQSVRERTSELAVLKTLGFSNAAVLLLVLAESHVHRASSAARSASGSPGSSSRAAIRRAASCRRSSCRHGTSRTGVGLMLAARAARRRAAGRPGHAPADHRRAEEELTWRWLRQTLAVTLLNLRTIPQRLGSSTVAIVGIAGVVVVLVAVLSIAEGFRAAMQDAGSPGRAIVHAQRGRTRK